MDARSPNELAAQFKTSVPQEESNHLTDAGGPREETRWARQASVSVVAGSLSSSDRPPRCRKAPGCGACDLRTHCGRALLTDGFGPVSSPGGRVGGRG